MLLFVINSVVTSRYKGAQAYLHFFLILKSLTLFHFANCALLKKKENIILQDLCKASPVLPVKPLRAQRMSKLPCELVIHLDMYLASLNTL